MATKTITRKNIADLAAEISLTPKNTRRVLRSLASQTEKPVLTKGESKKYEWNTRQFQQVVKLVNQHLVKLEEQCDPRCTGSVSESCECHCGGANHGIHAAH